MLPGRSWVRVEWLYETQGEFRDTLTYYQTRFGTQSARRLADQVLGAVENLERFPQMGVLREDLRLGQYGFRALFVGHHVCIYRIQGDAVYIYHFADARTNYIYRFFGLEPEVGTED